MESKIFLHRLKVSGPNLLTNYKGENSDLTVDHGNQVIDMNLTRNRTNPQHVPPEGMHLEFSVTSALVLPKAHMQLASNRGHQGSPKQGAFYKMTGLMPWSCINQEREEGQGAVLH